MPIEYTVIIATVSVICTVLGAIMGASNIQRFQRLDARNEGEQLTRVAVQLEHIGAGVKHIQMDITSMKVDANLFQKEYQERMVRVEESVKQAHRRLDEVLGYRGKQGQEKPKEG